MSVQVPLRRNYRIPDARFLTDPSFAEDVISTGVSLVKMKESMETKHVLDSRAKTIIDEHEERFEIASKAFEKKKRELLSLCEDKDEVIRQKEKALHDKRHEYQQLQLELREEKDEVIRQKDRALQDKIREYQQLQNELRENTSHIFETGRLSGKKECEELLERERHELQERKQEIERLKFEKEDMIKVVLDEVGLVSNMFKARKGFSATEIGEMGQHFAEEWIDKYYDPADYTVMASEAHSADILFHHEGVHILIEVKNRSKLTNEDLVKYHNDIETHAGKTFNYHAAILVSLFDTRLIDSCKTCNIEFRNNMPVLYIGGIKETPLLFTAAIRMATKLARLGLMKKQCSVEEEDSLESVVAAHKDTAIQFMRLVYKTQDDINKDRKLHQEGLVRLNCRERDLVEYVSIQSELLRSFPTLEEEVKVFAEAKVGKAKTMVSREVVLDWMITHDGKMSAQ